jgi:hypothetical protein
MTSARPFLECLTLCARARIRHARLQFDALPSELRSRDLVDLENIELSTSGFQMRALPTEATGPHISLLEERDGVEPTKT